MSDPAGTWSFWSVAIGGGIIGGIIGALMESYSAFLLEGLRQRRRERKELIDLARNWEAAKLEGHKASGQDTANGAACARDTRGDLENWREWTPRPEP